MSALDDIRTALEESPPSEWITVAQLTVLLEIVDRQQSVVDAAQARRAVIADMVIDHAEGGARSTAPIIRAENDLRDALAALDALEADK